MMKLRRTLQVLFFGVIGLVIIGHFLPPQPPSQPASPPPSASGATDATKSAPAVAVPATLDSGTGATHSSTEPPLAVPGAPQNSPAPHRVTPQNSTTTQHRREPTLTPPRAPQNSIVVEQALTEPPPDPPSIPQQMSLRDVSHDVSHDNFRDITQVKRDDYMSNRNTSYYGNHLFVTFSIQDNFTLNMMAWGAAMTMRRAAKWQIENGKAFYMMSFEAQARVVDKYGHESLATVFSVDFLYDDLKQVAWQNIDVPALLDLAYGVGRVSHPGQQFLSAFCEENSGQAPRFCAKVAGA
jgi:hypothetical protein